MDRGKAGRTGYGQGTVSSDDTPLDDIHSGSGLVAEKAKRLQKLADLLGRAWSPHTWSNGYGLLANLHVALAVSTCPYIEVPLDPPGWALAFLQCLHGLSFGASHLGAIAFIAHAAPEGRGA